MESNRKEERHKEHVRRLENDPDYQRADRVVDQILSETGLEIDYDIVVSDIQEDAEDFNHDLRVLEDFDLEMPAVKVDGESIPVALSLLFAKSTLEFRAFWGRRDPYFYDWVRGVVGDHRRRGKNHSEPEPRNRYRAIAIDQLAAERISLSEARSTFISRATEFLATRIAGVRGDDGKGPTPPPRAPLNIFQKTGGPRIVTPGCVFSVASNSPGLRAFWSGAYRINPRYFGHPTVATGVLQSGTYIFGVDGGAYGNNIQWDTQAVVSLPGATHIHLNY